MFTNLLDRVTKGEESESKSKREEGERASGAGSSQRHWGFWVSLGAGTLVPSVQMIFVNT